MLFYHTCYFICCELCVVWYKKWKQDKKDMIQRSSSCTSLFRLSPTLLLRRFWDSILAISEMTFLEVTRDSWWTRLTHLSVHLFSTNDLQNLVGIIFWTLIRNYTLFFKVYVVFYLLYTLLFIVYFFKKRIQYKETFR